VSDRQGFILLLIKDNDLITIQEMSLKIKVPEKTVKQELAVLQEKGILTREGGRKDGKWVIKD
jgi:DeoR/GlpR family transcriptional regulator of sugar metabolism